jgi:hypothetical protein
MYSLSFFFANGGAQETVSAASQQLQQFPPVSFTFFNKN